MSNLGGEQVGKDWEVVEERDYETMNETFEEWAERKISESSLNEYMMGVKKKVESDK